MKGSVPPAKAPEARTVGFLAIIFALRMFGLFMILPVFALYGQQLHGATPALIGLAIGVYGLMQAALQIPFGMLSDRVGRRPLIVFGLLLFVLGGVVAALSEHIYGVIAGRALQGAGAIASVIMALVGDVVTEKHRTRAMAMIGMSVGGAFVLALIAGPILAEGLGLSGMFWSTALFGAVAILVALLVPAPSHLQGEALPAGIRFRRVLNDKTLLRLDAGIFALHLVMTASFVVVPTLLAERLGVSAGQQSLLYLAVLVLGFITMVPLIIRAERRQTIPVKRFAIGLLAVSQIVMVFAQSDLVVCVAGMLLFFTAFNLLEALLPSMVGRAAPAGTRGTAMGVYSTSQFLGVFVGAQCGGILAQWWSAESVFVVCAGVSLLWLVLLTGQQELRKLDNRAIALPAESDAASALAKLRALAGVVEVVWVEERRLALLKVDNSELDESQLEGVAAAE